MTSAFSGDISLCFRFVRWW